jgi:DNA-binding MarR family transcriptional regulator
LSLDSATLSGVLDRMAESGWITKTAVSADRRVLNIQLTGKSQNCREEFVKDTEALNQEILSIFSTEERLLLMRMRKDLRKEIVRVMFRMQDKTGKHGGQDVQQNKGNEKNQKN